MFVIKESSECGIGFGVNVFNLDNPICKKGKFRICFADFYLNNKNVYALYNNLKLVGYFMTLKDAKNNC